MNKIKNLLSFSNLSQFFVFNINDTNDFLIIIKFKNNGRDMLFLYHLVFIYH